MAKNTLPVNYKDDILNSTMDGKRRYRMITNSDGTVSFEDVTTYDQVGSSFGAAQLNAANTAVNASADSNKIIDDLSTIAANTQEGYMAGALAVKELNQSLTDKMTFYVLSSSTDTRDDYSVGFLIDNSLIGYMIFNMGWVHVRYEVDTTGVRTYIKYGSNEWWRFS